MAENARKWLLVSCFSVLYADGAKGRRFGGRRRNCFGRHTPILQIFPKRQMEALLKKTGGKAFVFPLLLFIPFFISKAKAEGISVILVGHVNKEGGIAGPKVLEHMVDAVLSFEGDKRQSYRIIRANKNRYGSTNEIGVFEMTDVGLKEVPNPSEMLLADRPTDTSGNCAICTVEGTRPLVAEIQALVTKTAFPAPRRTSNGMDYNRVCLILAVLEKRLGLHFSSHDVYLNVIGGMQIDEPAADLGVALSLISSLTDSVIPDDLIAIGELGLSGECRGVANIEQRVREAARLGFTRAVIPHHNIQSCSEIKGITLVSAKNVYDILRLIRSTSNKKDQ